MQKRRLLTIFVIVFIDLLGFSLILPLLPFYAESYQASPGLVGLLVASYAAMQLIGAPLLGRLSDRYGRRPVLLISILGTFIGFLLLGFADPLGRGLAGVLPFVSQNQMILAVMFFSRMLDGLTGGNISVAQAYITDITTVENRAKGMGLIGAAFGLGFIIGPALGGILTRWGYAAPAFAAALISGINLLMVFAWLTESLPAEKRHSATEKKPLLSVRALTAALGRPRVGPLLQIRFVYGLAFATFETIFTLYAAHHLGLSAEATGYLLAYVGVLVVIVQGGLIGPLTSRYSEVNLMLIGVVLMGFSLFGWAVVPNVWQLMIVMIPLALAAGVLNTVINSLISKSVYPEEVGGTLGLASSIESITRVISPTLGGFLLGSLGTWAPGMFGAVLMGIVTILVWQRLIAHPDPPLPARDPGEQLSVSH